MGFDPNLAKRMEEKRTAEANANAYGKPKASEPSTARQVFAGVLLALIVAFVLFKYLI